jgi:hypothetical protein
MNLRIKSLLLVALDAVGVDQNLIQESSGTEIGWLINLGVFDDRSPKVGSQFSEKLLVLRHR